MSESLAQDGETEEPVKEGKAALKVLIDIGCAAPCLVEFLRQELRAWKTFTDFRFVDK